MKKVPLQYGNTQIEIEVPYSAQILSSGQVEPVADPTGEILRSLKEPIGTKTLPQLAEGRSNAAVVVSDNTRPVPYKGRNGIISPIIETLKQRGINDIKIIVACGTHRPMTEAELRQMLGDIAFGEGIEVINHIGTDENMLSSIGHTARTPNVTVNRHYMQADLKIATGLVEPHFMAGVSGGRKAICPGICGQEIMYVFHGGAILNEENAASMVLEGNPCHEESLCIAKMAGVDFIVNVTLNSQKQVIGVFSGELEKAHLAAVEQLRSFAIIELDQLYDLVITQAGEVGINHYQCAKAAFEACGAVKDGGKIIMVGDLTDSDPVGGQNYKQMLELIRRLGAKEFMQTILADDWTFTPEQWQVQMWAKVFEKLGSPEHVYSCMPQLEDCPEELIPEINVASQIKRSGGECNADFARRIMQQTIDQVIKSRPDGKVLVLPDGPYAVPVFGGKSLR